MEFLVAHGEALLFFIFAAVALGGALAVVTLRNPMYGAMGLLASFLAVAALFLLRRAEFLGMVQIFVYGGGIMVLFLFVIMLVNLHKLREVRMFAGTGPLALVLVVLLAAFVIYFFASAPFGERQVPGDQFLKVGDEIAGNSQAVAWVLFRDALLPFEIASLFLLVAMIGAVVLGRKQ